MTVVVELSAGIWGVCGVRAALFSTAEETLSLPADTPKSKCVAAVYTAWVQIPVLPLSSWVTLGELLNPLSLSFPVCKALTIIV